MALGVNAASVRRWCANGEVIGAIDYGKGWLIDPTIVQVLKKKRGKMGTGEDLSANVARLVELAVGMGVKQPALIAALRKMREGFSSAFDDDARKAAFAGMLLEDAANDDVDMASEAAEIAYQVAGKAKLDNLRLRSLENAVKFYFNKD